MLTLADHSPVEVTVSNLGTHGVDWFTGIIPVGQVGLLTIGRIRSGLDVSTDAFRIRKLMWVTANLDHRELDGADGSVLLDLFQQSCSVSLGDPAVFRIGPAGGGPTTTVRLNSGDVCLLSGEARLARHGIDRVLAGGSSLIPGGGRLNLTLRRARPRDC